eukprot:CAMPEP_0113586314 /NCGR_PEP_ID=MMETSP0015_2-20120614/34229_1 /TAXON_ID=2838 /ORGANISM="Odontella" /LENGTH=77 /DNA_ID=CAMNT_0000491739 /DNA_START=474 /DNA_END=707 /DNA_ORIENTATION=- /assembly_acc=CAM_ASM_000160
MTEDSGTTTIDVRFGFGLVVAGFGSAVTLLAELQSGCPDLTAVIVPQCSPQGLSILVFETEPPLFGKSDHGLCNLEA